MALIVVGVIALLVLIGIGWLFLYALGVVVEAVGRSDGDDLADEDEYP